MTVPTTIAAFLLAGCAATQTITEFDEAAPTIVCIAENEEVREGVLEALEEAFQQHGTKTIVVSAAYEEKDSARRPTVDPAEVQGCDAVASYVALWTWDMSTYMYYADILVADTETNNKIAQATYQTGNGLDKWIIARKKILELVDEMYESEGHQPTE